MHNSQARYQELVYLINNHNHRYYVLSQPVVSDAEYDKLYCELQTLEAAHPELRQADSPTQRVGSDLLSGFKSVRHACPVLSLGNIFSIEDLDKRLDDLNYGSDTRWIVEPKIDGLSVILRFDKGLLVEGLTRGNGEFGDDVTNNARTIKSIPLRLLGSPDKIPEVLFVRGEIFIEFKVFMELNEERKKAGLELFANPRNAASGGLKLLDSRECARRRLSFIPYEIMTGDDKFLAALTDDQHQITQTVLPGFGFQELSSVVSFSDKSELLDYITKFEALKARLPYPTDGAVVKIQSRAARTRWPDGTKDQKHSWAYKYQSETADTKLKSITIQVGRLGTLTPVANLEAITLDGSVIERATLCNRDYISRLGIDVGDIVKIQKAGTIIPQILSVTTKNLYICPNCRFRGTLKEQEEKHNAETAGVRR